MICSSGRLRIRSLGCVFPANISAIVRGPSLPIYIITIKTYWLALHSRGVRSAVSPTVPTADAVS